MRKFIFLLIVVLLALPIATSYAATYETTVAANARTCAKVTCDIVARLPKGTVIEVTEVVQGDKFNGKTEWLKFSYNGRTAYVHGSLAKLAAGALPPVTTTTGGSSTGNSTTAVVPVPTEAPVSQPPAQTQLVCGNCSSMSSCDQAMACLAAGNGRLDGDGDGIPCESICR